MVKTHFLRYNYYMENKEKLRHELKKKIKSMNEEELIDFVLNNEIELNWYKEQLELLKKQRFSGTGEKVVNGQLNLFNEVEDIADHSQEEVIEEEVVVKKKRKKTKETDYSRLPVIIKEHKLEDDKCEICGNKLKQLAPQIIDELMYEPARFYIVRHIVYEYICTECTENNEKAEIIIAKGEPNRLIKGSIVTPSVVAGIAFNKYVSGTPLYRQEQELKRKRLMISRATMSNWLMRSSKLLEPIYDKMIEELRTQRHLHMDETTVTVLEDRKDRQKSYMWMMASGKHEENKCVIYSYHENREYGYATELLGEGYKGSIHSDGYEAYHKLNGVTVMGCMAHMRRYFVEAMEVNPLHKEAKNLNGKRLQEYCQSHPSYGNIVHIVDEIRKLFRYEKTYVEQGYDEKEIEKRRQEEQKPILDELFTYIRERESEYASKSKMGKAITYALNQKEYLMNYLTDGKAEISNNRGERYIKPFVMGRKAWLFSKTKSGAKMSSNYYSLIESAKENNLDIQKYLTYVLEMIKENGKSVDYDKLMPYSKDIPEHIRVK